MLNTYLVTYLSMFLVNKNTAVVSSTHLQRNYKEVQNLLKTHRIVVVTNRNSDKKADAILLSYSEGVVENIEDFLEDLEMVANRKNLIKKLKKSHASGKGKLVSIDAL